MMQQLSMAPYDQEMRDKNDKTALKGTLRRDEGQIMIKAFQGTIQREEG